MTWGTDAVSVENNQVRIGRSSIEKVKNLFSELSEVSAPDFLMISLPDGDLTTKTDYARFLVKSVRDQLKP